MIGPLVVPTIILAVALFTDLKSRKIPNKWIVISMVLALASSYYFFQFEGIKQGAIASLVALFMTLPLVLLGALGAGDMKLMFAFGLASSYPVVFAVVVLSFVWGAVIGVALAIFRGRGKLLITNTFKIIAAKTQSKEELHKIPYTVALLLGWITYILLGLKQGAFL